MMDSLSWRKQGDELMLDDTRVLALLAEFYTAANVGDIDAASHYFADDITVINGDQHTASNRDEFLAALKAGQEAGWTGQRLISAGVKNNVVAGLYENLFADGSSSIGAGAILFNDDEKMCQIRTVTADRVALRMPGQ